MMELFTCLLYFAPRRRRIQRQKGPVMQLHRIALSFDRQMQDASRKFFWPNIVMAVSSESYPGFIKSGFNDYHGLGIQRAIVIAMHVPLLAVSDRLAPFLVGLVINWQHLANSFLRWLTLSCAVTAVIAVERKEHPDIRRNGRNQVGDAVLVSVVQFTQ
jgi:hypothetical protein